MGVLQEAFRGLGRELSANDKLWAAYSERRLRELEEQREALEGVIPPEAPRASSHSTEGSGGSGGAREQNRARQFSRSFGGTQGNNGAPGFFGGGGGDPTRHRTGRGSGIGSAPATEGGLERVVRSIDNLGRSIANGSTTIRARGGF